MNCLPVQGWQCINAIVSNHGDVSIIVSHCSKLIVHVGLCKPNGGVTYGVFGCIGANGFLKLVVELNGFQAVPSRRYRGHSGRLVVFNSELCPFEIESRA